MRAIGWGLLLLGSIGCGSVEPSPANEVYTPTPEAPTQEAAAPAPSASVTEPPVIATSPPASTATTTASAAAPSAPVAPANERVDPDGLRVTDLATGSGRAVRDGSTVLVHYEGALENGAIFDSSIARGAPFKAEVGKGQIIKGWERGLLGMRVGGRRKLVIPPELAYGARGIPPTIPPNATLVFQIQLLDVR